MVSAVLKVVGGKQDGKLIPLTTKKFLIGREQDCHLRPNSDSVSRHHCVITVDDFTVHVRDLGSSNGTYLNNIRIAGLREVKNGDRLRIGSLEFEFGVRKGVPAPVGVGAGSSSSTASVHAPDPGGPEAPATDETAMLAASDTVVMKVFKESPATPAEPPLSPEEDKALAESPTAIMTAAATETIFLFISQFPLENDFDYGAKFASVSADLRIAPISLLVGGINPRPAR